MWIDWSIIGTAQRKKIIKLFAVLCFSFIIIILTQLLIVGKNAYKQAQIYYKKSNISNKKESVDRLNKTISDLKNEKIKTNLIRKNGMYKNLDKQKLITNIYQKMNGMEDLDAWDEMRKKKKDLEYSSFAISSSPIISLYPQKIFDSYIQKYIFLPSQSTKILFDGNKVNISFNADYEYVAYRILQMIENIFPGYIVITKFEIQPINEENKKLLYEMKFYKKEANIKTDGRLRVNIEFDWYFIKNIKGYEQFEKEKTNDKDTISFSNDLKKE